MKLSHWFTTALLFITTSAGAAHASDFERFPRGTKIEAAIPQLETPVKVRAELVVNIGKVMSHPAIQKVKAKLSESGLQCTLIRLWLAAYQALSDGAHSPMAIAGLRHVDDDILRLEGLEADWCDDQGGGKGADVVKRTMLDNGIKLYMPFPDVPGEARVAPRSRAADIYQGFMAAGIIIQQRITSTGSALLSEGMPSGSGFFLFINPKYLYDPAKKSDPRQGM